MTDLLINKTTLTPQVQFLTSGNLLIKGISTPENTMAFFKPLYSWLTDLKYTQPKKISLVLEIEYLNSTSMKALVELLIMLDKMRKEGITVEVMWRYEKGDDDMHELGVDLKSGSNSEVIFVPV